MVRATIRPPASAARGRGLELAGRLVRRARVDGQEVPVERPPRRGGHGHHEVDLLVGEGVEASVGDVLEGGARVVADHLAEGQHLAAVGVAGRDRVAVAVGVGAGLGGREAEAAGLERLGQQPGHLGHLLVGGHLAAPLVAHHPPAEGAVADEEAGVDAEVPLELAQVVAEAGPVPGEAVLQGHQGHALDLGHHPADVVVVLGLDRGQGEAAVAADHRGHAVEVGGGGGRVPEQLGVVVGVGVDDAGRHHQALGVQLGGALLVDLAHGHDPPVADADVGPPTGCAGPVDDQAVADHVVEHGGGPSVGGEASPIGGGVHASPVRTRTDRPSVYGTPGRSAPDGRDQVGSGSAGGVAAAPETVAGQRRVGERGSTVGRMVISPNPSRLVPEPSAPGGRARARSRSLHPVRPLGRGAPAALDRRPDPAPDRVRCRWPPRASSGPGR